MAKPDQQGTRATLKTISELTGLSQSTVSLSLRGGTTLKEETHRKVAEAAAKVGYVPNRAGVRLRTGKTNVIALLLDSGDDSIDFARYLIQGVGHAIRDTPYHLTVIPEFGRKGSVESTLYILDNHTADGVIVTHTSAQDPRIKLLMERNFPFVSHGRTEFFTPHPYHDFHSEAFASLAVERLVAKGCSNLMLVIGDDRTYNYHNISIAFGRTAARLGVTTRIFGQKTGYTIPEEIRKTGQELATGGDCPDGIICDGEMRSIALISGLQNGGAMLGSDFQFVCKQTSNLLHTIFPSIDTIEEDVHASGIELAQLLIRRIDGEAAEALQTLTEPVPHWYS